MLGKFLKTDEIVTHTYKIPYDIVNGTILSFYGFYSPGEAGLIADITSEKTEVLFEFKLPRNYPYKNINVTGFNPIILLNDQEHVHKSIITQTDCFYNFFIPFENDAHIEVYLDYRPTDNIKFPNYGDNLPESCIPKTIRNHGHNPFILTPYQQLKHGTSIHEIKCMYPKELYVKDEQKPLCLKPETYEILVERGYF